MDETEELEYIEAEIACEEFAAILELAAQDLTHIPQADRDQLRAAAIRIREVADNWGYHDRDVVK
jgi:hypothetical protein